jgi:hypothetical protein
MCKQRANTLSAVWSQYCNMILNLVHHPVATKLNIIVKSSGQYVEQFQQYTEHDSTVCPDVKEMVHTCLAFLTTLFKIT